MKKSTKSSIGQLDGPNSWTSYTPRIQKKQLWFFFGGGGLLFKKKVLKNIKGHKATWGGGSGNIHLMVKRDS